MKVCKFCKERGTKDPYSGEYSWFCYHCEPWVILCIILYGYFLALPLAWLIVWAFRKAVEFYNA